MQDNDIDGSGKAASAVVTAPQTVADVLDAAYAKVIAKIAMDSHAVGWQAGVGGSETAGVIVSYLAAHPDRIPAFMAGKESLLDWGDNHHRDGCLSWQGTDGKIWTPEAARAAATSARQGETK